MKKLKNFFRFWLISAFVLIFYIFICQILFNLFWNFDILDKKSYLLMAKFWEDGGVFNTFRDVSLIIALILMPIIWLIISRKIYKIGLKKLIIISIEKIYRASTRPETLEIEHVTIKNLGSENKNLDDIIAGKMKEQNQNNTTGGLVSRDLRRRIAAKIEENENQ